MAEAMPASNGLVRLSRLVMVAKTLTCSACARATSLRFCPCDFSDPSRSE